MNSDRRLKELLDGLAVWIFVFQDNGIGVVYRIGNGLCKDDWIVSLLFEGNWVLVSRMG